MNTIQITRYRATGSLTEPVTDVGAANAYLDTDEPMVNYLTSPYWHPDLEGVVADVRWSLTDAESWKIEMLTTRPLAGDEMAKVQDWAHGQNSDGLGEGFEQQPFAEHQAECDLDYRPATSFFGGGWEDDGEADFSMSSFDWQDNPVTFKEVGK